MNDLLLLTQQIAEMLTGLASPAQVADPLDDQSIALVLSDGTEVTLRVALG